MSIEILPIPALKDNYIWAIIDHAQHKAVIVDPGEAEPVDAFLEQHQLALAGILITHHHWDHTGGAIALQQQHGVPLIGPKNDPVKGLNFALAENDEASIEHFPMTFRVLDIPGHTLGHIAYYSAGVLFCGDTLFAAGCGRIFEGTPPQMFATLQKIAELPEATNIYCAHEYTLNNLRFAETVEPGNKQIAARLKKVSELRNRHLPSLPSTLAEEKATNPFLRCDSSEIQANVERYAGKKLHSALEVFTWLRKWKDEFRG
jgi:hydroxyacylglutathione hydrolase